MPALDGSLYYLENTTEGDYKSQPPGEFHVTKYFNGEPCWQQSTKKVLIPKTIILTSKASQDLSSIDFYKETHFLHLMLEEGFRVYLWLNNTLQILDAFELTKRYGYESTNNPSQNEIISAAKKKGIGPEKLLILDRSKLEKLLDKMKQCALYTSDFETTDIFDSGGFQDSKGMIGEIIINSYQPNSQITLNYLNTAFKNAPFKEQYTFVRVSERLMNESTKLLDICTQYPIKTVEFDPTCSATTIFKVLSKTPLVELIDLKFNNNLDKDLPIPLSSIKHLRSINTSNTNITLDNLELIINNAPELEELETNNCSRLIGSLNLQPHALKELKILELDYSNCSGENIGKVLKVAKKLQTLNIVNCKGLKRALGLVPNSLKHLAYINVSSSDISLKCLEELLLAAPNVIQIRIFNCSNIKGKHSLKPNSLSSLRLLQIAKTCKTIESLCPFFLAAPNIDAVNAGTVIGLTDCSLAPNSLLHLKKLILSQLTLANLTQILAAAPNLEMLAFIKYNFDDAQLTALQRQYPTIDFQVKGSTKSNSDEPNPQSIKRVSLLTDDFDLTEFFKPSPLISSYKVLNAADYSQIMIGRQISNYINLINKHTDLLNTIDEGICEVLSYCYLFSDDEQTWWANLEQLKQWDGSSAPSESVETFILMILNAVRGHAPTKKKFTYSGDNIVQQLELLQGLNPKIGIVSPWHAVAVIFSPSTSAWHLYDSNYSSKKSQQFSEIGSLVQELHRTLGPLFMINPVNTNSPIALLPQKINSVKDFIRSGGLLLALDLENRKELTKVLKKETANLDELDLQGLLLLFSKIPAWLWWIDRDESDTVEYILDLLFQFSICDPKNVVDKLINSMSCLDAERQKLSLQRVLKKITTSNKPYDLLKTQINKWLIRHHPNPQQEVYRKALQKSSYETQSMCDLQPYVQRVIRTDNGAKRLVTLTNAAELYGLAIAIESYCHSINRPIFYVNSPTDLQCQGKRVIPDPFIPEQGSIKEGFGGAFFSFLTQTYPANNPPIILINLQNIPSRDMPRFISMFKKNRVIDGVVVPKQFKIIALMNLNSEGCYLEDDLYCEFEQNIEACPVPSSQLIKPNCAQPIEQSEEECTKIDLYNSSNWKSRLLGRWTIDGVRLTYKPGLLNKALEKGKPILINNGLWDNAEFEFFWQQAISRGYFSYNGQRLNIPSTCRLYRAQGYDWQVLDQANCLVKASAQLGYKPGKAELMCHSLFNGFFSRYLFDQGLIHNQTGLIEQQAGGDLSINVVEVFDEHEWFMFLDECIKHEVTPHFYFSEIGYVPEAMKSKLSSARQDIRIEISDPLLRVIVSSDIDVTIADINKNRNYQVVDISECSECDLLQNMIPQFMEKESCFQFNPVFGALHHAILNKQPIILKGRFSIELANTLMQLSNKRSQEPSESKAPIVLVTQQEDRFTGISIERHEVTVAEKLTYFYGLQFSHNECSALNQIEKTPSCELRARLTYNRLGWMDKSPWEGLRSLPPHIHLDAFDLEHSNLRTQEFIESRKSQINAVLQYEPYVIISGLTGVGKSTFVLKHLNDENTKIYTPDTVEERLNSIDDDKRHILFIDEANIGSKEWSEVESFYDNPNGFVYKKARFDKVIFAANPTDYSHERQLAPIFARHGNALIFQPMPQEYIYTQILKPIFSGDSLSEEEIAAIVQSILTVYQFVTNNISDRVAISPRELEMMAMLTRSYLKANPNSSLTPQQVACHYAHRIGLTVIDDELKPRFNEVFQPNVIIPVKSCQIGSSVVLTPSLAEAATQVKEILALRILRQRPHSNDSQKFAGLGGLILEGEPGLCKASLLQQILEEDSVEYVEILPSMDNAVKIKLILEAFDQGKVVLIKKINTTPFLEKLLNDLLMGKHPEGRRPTTPGFLILGTQDPISMSGRHSMSPALSRRLLTTSVKAPEGLDLDLVLLKKGLSTVQAFELRMIYELSCEEAEEKKAQNPQLLRSILDIAEEIAKRRSKIRFHRSIDTPLEETNHRIKIPRII